MLMTKTIKENNKNNNANENNDYSNNGSFKRYATFFLPYFRLFILPSNTFSSKFQCFLQFYVVELSYALLFLFEYFSGFKGNLKM